MISLLNVGRRSVKAGPQPRKPLPVVEGLEHRRFLSVAPLAATDPGADATTALDIGTLGAKSTSRQSDTIGTETDTADFYQFTVTDNVAFTAKLVAKGKTAKLSHPALQTSNVAGDAAPGSGGKSAKLVLGPGTYYVGVTAQPAGETPYQLTLATKATKKAPTFTSTAVGGTTGGTNGGTGGTNASPLVGNWSLTETGTSDGAYVQNEHATLHITSYDFNGTAAHVVGSIVLPGGTYNFDTDASDTPQADAFNIRGNGIDTFAVGFQTNLLQGHFYGTANGHSLVIAFVQNPN